VAAPAAIEWAACVTFAVLRLFKVGTHKSVGLASPRVVVNHKVGYPERAVARRVKPRLAPGDVRIRGNRFYQSRLLEKES
jgi:hypothetical protein